MKSLKRRLALDQLRADMLNAKKRLEAAGLGVTMHEESFQISVAGEHDSYLFYAHTGRWHPKAQTRRKYHRTGLEGLLRHERELEAVAAANRDAKIDLTLFADASFDGASGCAGWGCWMKAGAGRSIQHGGQIADTVRSSTEAEMRALANGLAVAKKLGLIGPRAVVMVQSDCLHALGWILAAHPASADRPAPGGLSTPKPRKMTARGAESSGLRFFVSVAAELELTIVTRHVKGHQEGPNRQWVNRLCDEIAGRHMRERRLKFHADKRALQEARK